MPGRWRSIARHGPARSSLSATPRPAPSRSLLRQMPPLAFGQVAQLQRPDAHADQVGHLQLHQFAHPPDLPVAPLDQHEAQHLRVLQRDLRRLQLACRPVPGPCRSSRDLLARRSGPFTVTTILLVDLALRPDDRLRQHAVLRQDQQPARILVEPPHRREARLRARNNALADHAPSRVSSRAAGICPCSGCAETRPTGLLITTETCAPSSALARDPFSTSVCPGAILRPTSLDALAVDQHRARLDQRLGLAPRAHAGLRQPFVDAHRLARRRMFWSSSISFCSRPRAITRLARFLGGRPA